MDGRRLKRLTLASLAACVSALLVVPAHQVPARAAFAVPKLPCGSPVIDAPRQGAAGRTAVQALSSAGALSQAAANVRMRPSAYEALLLTDPTIRVDACAQTFAVEPAPPAARGTAPESATPSLDPESGEPTAAGVTTAGSLDASGDPWSLSSRPESNRTILLDFDGMRITGTQWNNYAGNPDWTAPPFSADADTSTFSAAELDTVRGVWLRVAEDFAAFDVNVTTVDPGPAAITRTDTADLVYGTRALVTNDTVVRNACGGCGGSAYVGAFNRTGSHPSLQPAFVFPASLSFNAKNIAEAVSHEVGHNLGLMHDGTSTTGYYGGHGSWAPIMGVGYGKPVTQWSNGEYDGANNREDDLEVIRSYGLDRLADDHANSSTQATALNLASSAGGVISDRTDVDYFSFTLTSPKDTTARVTPHEVGGNLDVRVSLFDAAGTMVATDDPAVSGTGATATGLGAAVAGTLAAGTYYVSVSGVGFGSPLNTGYSSYGSLGRYIVRVADSTEPLVDTAPPTPVTLTGTAGSGRVSLQWTASSDASGISAYRIYRAVGTTGCFSVLATVPGSAASHTDTTVTSNAQYRYYVVAIDGATMGKIASPSNTVASPKDASAAPMPALAAQGCDRKVTLQWAKVADPAGVKGYELWRATGSGAATLRAKTGASTTAFADTTAVNDTTYTYTLRYVDLLGRVSSPSAPVVATAADTAPPSVPAPTITAGDGKLSLKWAASKDTGAVRSYLIYRAVGSGPFGAPIVVPGSSLTYVDSGLTNYTSYRYQMSAMDTRNQTSAGSAIKTSAPKDLTAPAAVTVSGSASDSRADISWTGATDVSGIAGYRVYRSVGTSTSYSSVTTLSASARAFTQTGLLAGTSYRYLVRAVDTKNNLGVPPAPASMTTPTTGMRVPTITATLGPAGSTTTPGTFVISVNSDTSAAAPVAAAKVAFHIRDGAGTIVATKSLTTTADGAATLQISLARGTTYAVTVTAVTAVGRTWNGVTPGNSVSVS